MKFLFAAAAATLLHGSTCDAKRGKSSKSDSDMGRAPPLLADDVVGPAVRPLTKNEDASVLFATIHQIWVGSQDDCDGNGRRKNKKTRNNTMNRLVGVYTDPDTNELECFRDYNVDACFENLVGLACVDGMASIDLYLSDNSFSKKDRVDNPNVKRECGLTRQKKLLYTKKVTVELPCPAGNVHVGGGGGGLPAPPVECQTGLDCPIEGEYCGFSLETGSLCKPYAKIGEGCGGVGIPGLQGVCDPSESYCDEDLCEGTPGVCVVNGPSCSSDTDCSSGDICNEAGFCRARPKDCNVPNTDKDGVACTSRSDCDGGLNCLLDQRLGESFCTSSCDDDADCSELQYCSLENQCANYLRVDEKCSDDKRCDPGTGFCFAPQACNGSSDGLCLALGNRCALNTDCDTDSEYCDVLGNGRCQPKLQMGDCCKSGQLCADGLACPLQDEFPVCTSEDDKSPVSPVCASDGDCSEEEFCHDRECAPFRKLGEPCGGYVIGTPERCDPDLFCYKPSDCSVPDAPGVCLELGPPCDRDAPCGDGFFCGTTNCVPLRGEGACCDNGDSDSCMEGLICDSAAEQNPWPLCVVDPETAPKPPVVEAGSPCTAQADCGPSGDYFCSDNECVLYKKLGEACGSYNVGPSEACAPDLFCYKFFGCAVPDDPGVCEAKGPSCDNDAPCPQGFYCRDTVCFPLVEEGACCRNYSDSCMEGLICDSAAEQNPWPLCVVDPDTVVSPPPGGSNEDECVNDNDCEASEFCTPSSRVCKPYAAIGSSCEGFVPKDDLFERCDPSVGFCQNKVYCDIADVSGTCVAYGADCSNDDPNDTSTNSCAVDEVCNGDRCVPRLAEGDCCAVTGDCLDGLECEPDADGRGPFCWAPPEMEGPEIGSGGPVVGPGPGGINQAPAECVVDDDCPDNKWCASPENFMNRPEDNNGPTAVCWEYVSIGDRCGGFVQGIPDRCNPVKDFCYYPEGCTLQDLSGSCRPLGEECNRETACGSDDMYCDLDLQRCKPKKAVGECCEVDDECAKDLLCPGDPGICAVSDDEGTSATDSEITDSTPCDDDADCGTEFFCSQAAGGNTCTPFLAMGASCGGRTATEQRCRDYCFNARSCQTSAAVGTCMAFGSKCSSDGDCSGTTTTNSVDEYCTSEFYCAPMAQEGDCCSDSFPCADGLTCSGDDGLSTCVAGTSRQRFRHYVRKAV